MSMTAASTGLNDGNRSMIASAVIVDMVVEEPSVICPVNVTKFPDLLNNSIWPESMSSVALDFNRALSSLRV